MSQFMSPGFVLLLVVVTPSAFVLGVLVGWNRGREAAEQSIDMLRDGIERAS